LENGRDRSVKVKAMPKKGFASVTIDSEAYNLIIKARKQANNKAGYKKYRSVAHFITEAVMRYIEDEPK
jgi:hypothetical protein